MADTIVDCFSSQWFNLPILRDLLVQVDLNAELERLRIELKHVQNLCEVAQNESIDASQRVSVILSVYTIVKF